jgi:hypothetical protein
VDTSLRVKAVQPEGALSLTIDGSRETTGQIHTACGREAWNHFSGKNDGVKIWDLVDYWQLENAKNIKAQVKKKHAPRKHGNDSEASGFLPQLVTSSSLNDLRQRLAMYIMSPAIAFAGGRFYSAI